MDKWLAGKIGCIILYIGAFALLIMKKSWYFLAGLAGLHFTEFILFGKRAGRLAKTTIFDSFINTMLFGYNWWIPTTDKAHEINDKITDPSRFSQKGVGIQYVPTKKK